MRINRIIFIVFLGSLYSCTDSSIVAEKATPLTQEWDRDKELIYEIDIKDTISTYSFSTIIQNTHEYPFCNLYLKYAIVNDSNNVVNSNFQELRLYSATSGKPLGKEFLLSDTQEGTYPLSNQIKFDYSGKYKVILKHQMRDNQNLSGIKSVGIQLRTNE